MKTLVITFLLLQFSIVGAYSQEAATTETMIYNPEANVNADLAKAIAQAREDDKYVFVQIGGNWCKWCVKFHQFVNSDQQIDSMIKANYVVVKVNYDKENKNSDILNRLEHPERFGFPVFVILKNGKRIHTQDSGYLESGAAYDKKKVMRFLQNWTVDALNPEHYKKKD